jgi:hypothetical protein
MNLEKLLTDRLEGTRSERVSLKAILEVHEEKMKKLLNQLSVLAKAGSSHRDTEVGSSDNPELHVSLSCSHIDCNRLTYIHALPLQEKLKLELIKLEKDHATTSQDNKNEREFMRERDKIR